MTFISASNQVLFFLEMALSLSKSTANRASSSLEVTDTTKSAFDLSLRKSTANRRKIGGGRDGSSLKEKLRKSALYAEDQVILRKPIPNISGK